MKESEALICRSYGDKPHDKPTDYERAAESISLKPENVKLEINVHWYKNTVFVTIPEGSRLTELMNEVYELAGGKDKYYGRDIIEKDPIGQITKIETLPHPPIPPQEKNNSPLVWKTMLEAEKVVSRGLKLCRSLKNKI